jgi:hypothetical protein
MASPSVRFQLVFLLDRLTSRRHSDGLHLGGTLKESGICFLEVRVLTVGSPMGAVFSLGGWLRGFFSVGFDPAGTKALRGHHMHNLFYLFLLFIYLFIS